MISDTAAAAPVKASNPPVAKKPRSRAGSVSQGRDGSGPARPTGDGSTVRPAFDPVYVAEKLDIWRLNEKGGGFMVRSSADNEWMPLTRSELEAELQCIGLAKGDAREPVREVERVIHYVQQHKKVDMVMNLAGYWPGVVKLDTLRVLVRKGPELLEPRPGDFAVLRSMLEGMFMLPLEGPEMPHYFHVFVKSTALPHDRALEIWQSMVRQIEVADDERGEVVVSWVLDQTVLVYSWLFLMLEVMYRRRDGDNVARNGHALIVAGKADGGKSLFMGLLKKMLGGRRANVEQYLTGKTPFNMDAASSEFLGLSDAPLSTRMEDRALLGEFIKETVAEVEHRIHPKGKDASYTVPLIRRLVWAHNDDQDNLRQMPPMKPEVRDKIIWVRANAVAMPMATTELDDYMAFGRKLDEQLPCFVHWLMNEFRIPAALKGGRFGMLGVQEPSLIREMQEDSDPGRFLELLDAARWVSMERELNFWDYIATLGPSGNYSLGEDGKVWTGGHFTLKEMLVLESCSVWLEFADMFKRHRIDRLLGRLKKDEPGRVEQYRTNASRLWRIICPRD